MCQPFCRILQTWSDVLKAKIMLVFMQGEALPMAMLGDEAIIQVMPWSPSRDVEHVCMPFLGNLIVLEKFLLSHRLIQLLRETCKTI